MHMRDLSAPEQSKTLNGNTIQCFLGSRHERGAQFMERTYLTRTKPIWRARPWGRHTKQSPAGGRDL